MDQDKRFAHTEYVVEATDGEQFFLWKLYSNDVVWEQGSSGTIVTVGEVGKKNQKKRPVNISCYWNRINGMNVLFWYACSQLVDYVMIEKWLEENCYPMEHGSKRRATCDAMNFGSCISYSKKERPPIEEKERLIFPPQFFYSKPSKAIEFPKELSKA